jgi:hypothetical protein
MRAVKEIRFSFTNPSGASVIEKPCESVPRPDSDFRGDIAIPISLHLQNDIQKPQMLKFPCLKLPQREIIPLQESEKLNLS